MKYFVVFVLIVLNVLKVHAIEPPNKVQDVAAYQNDQELFSQMATHNHAGNGTQQIPKSATDIDDAITSNFAGQLCFNLTALELCISTQANINTAWVKVQAPTTACAN